MATTTATATATTTTTTYLKDEEQHSFFTAPCLNESSILNLTTDDDEEESAYNPNCATPLNQSVDYYYDATTPNYNNSSHCCEPTTMTTPTTTLDTTSKSEDWTSFSLLDTSIQNVTDSIVNGLCISGSNNNHEAVSDQQSHGLFSSSEPLSHDFLSLLGCVDPPTDDELVHVWPQQVVKPLVFEKRATRQERAERKLQQLPPHEYPPLKKTKSMDDSAVFRSKKSHNKNNLSLGDWLLGGNDDPLEQVIGKGLEPILPNEDDRDDDDDEQVLSYDSDPEDWELQQQHPCWSDPGVSTAASRERSLLDSSQDEEQQHIPYDFHRARIAERVKRALVLETHSSMDSSLQDTLNSTWSLTLHPPDGVAPTRIVAWMERGTMLNRGQTIVEPKLMWRKQRHHPHGLAPVSCKIRLLEICRIVTMSNNEQEHKSRYPYAHASRSFLLKTSLGDEYLLEAATKAECQQMVHGWKLCVARLASLAVVEDMETMAMEFFATSNVL